MRRFFLLLGLVPACVLCSFLVKKKRDLLIVFVGDSITYGAGLENPGTDSPPAVACEDLRKRPGIRRLAYSNQGVSGFTTVDFLPAAAGSFNKVLQTASDLSRRKKGLLIFSFMLGTNDSAMDGPNGSPVSPEQYRENLKTIIDSLLKVFPGSRMVINRPVWYSPNTYNGSKYLEEGLLRLQSYFPEIDKLVAGYSVTVPGSVFAGDKRAFGYFEQHFQTDFQQEHGQQGDFYLHPNQKGAQALGQYWADAVYAAVN